MADVPISTTKVIVTNHWLKVSDGACVLQSVNDRDAYSKTFFDLVIGGLAKSNDAEWWFDSDFDVFGLGG